MFLVDLRAPRLKYETLSYLFENAAKICVEEEEYRIDEPTTWVKNCMQDDYPSFRCYDQEGRLVFRYEAKHQVTHIDYRFFKPLIDDGHPALLQYYQF
ncbi:MAG: hypothetical protein ACSW8B_05610 [bacterium]